jgi:hypothetical protein
MPSRRDLLAAAAAALPPVLSEAQTTAPAYSPRVFSSAELDLIRGLAEAILPRTDTPGAADAHVHLYIDRAFSNRPPAETATFRRGLEAAGRELAQGKSHAAILTGLQTARSPFFKQLKDLTIDGYYTSKEGLAVELGWHGYTASPEFKGCTHKEHQG